MADRHGSDATGAPFWLVLPDGTRVALDRDLVIGRAADADVWLPDHTVSRTHARIIANAAGPLVEDAGSRYGTLLGGEAVVSPRPLSAGSVIRLGDVILRVEQEATPIAESFAQDDASAGHTLVVPVGATALGLRAPAPVGGVAPGMRPRVRSGWALKRLSADEGDKRFLLRELKSGSFLRMESGDARLFELVDGQRTVTELLAEAERLLGPSGPGRLARLLAELGDRGLLDGVAASPEAPRVARGSARFFRPREVELSWVPAYCAGAYRRWGRIFYSPFAATFLAVIALAGFGAFTYLIGSRYGTPFVVANRLVLGGAVFVLGRFGLVVLHEFAHGMALAHYKRNVGRGGIRLIFIFPYAFVDTSESYFEPRIHRIVISASGPISDLTLGALFAFLCAAWPAGAVRDVFFQLTFGAYVGAFFNLNPFLDRDGYQILVDVLREPGLRRRARAQFAQRLSGAAPGSEHSSVLGRYAIFGLVWSLLAAAFAVVFSTRYYDRLVSLAPSYVIVPIFVLFCAMLFIPVGITLAIPLWSRVRYGRAEVNRVVT